ncbi:hypothetical protein NEMIN01_0901 [Nematocida minor]|uniref:uncharacterized protein n=1 Tax=Nematocida minor TaxID=1912983 RepID=UPI00221F792E|nr:uncharacterized protein NEMIN01_0901 [Nematocida minor]KAI5190202.1 hypothetical protein NEMIN01_0901 [Nematocida minor]
MNDGKETDEKKRIMKRNFFIVAISVLAVLIIATIAYYTGFLTKLFGEDKVEEKAPEVKVEEAGSDPRRLLESIDINSLIMWNYKKLGEKALFEKTYAKREDEAEEVEVSDAKKKVENMEKVLKNLQLQYKEHIEKAKNKQLASAVSNVLQKSDNLRYILLMTDDPQEFLEAQKILADSKCTDETLLATFNWLLTGQTQRNIDLILKIMNKPIQETGIEEEMRNVLDLMLRIIVTNPYKATYRRIVGAVDPLETVLANIYRAVDNLVSYNALKKSAKSNGKDKEALDIIEKHRERLRKNKIREEEVTVGYILEFLANIQHSANIDNELYINTMAKMVRKVKNSKIFYTNKEERSLDFFLTNIINYIAMGGSARRKGALNTHLENQLNDVHNITLLSIDGVKNPNIKNLGDVTKTIRIYTKYMDETCTFIDRFITLISFEMQYFLGKYPFRCFLTEIARSYIALLESKMTAPTVGTTFMKHTMDSQAIASFLEMENKSKLPGKYAYVTPTATSLFSPNEKIGNEPINVIKRAMEDCSISLAQKIDILNGEKKTK